MSDSRPVQFGVIGAGRIAQNAFVPALRLTDEATLAAAASRDVKRARSLEPERAYGSYEELLNDPSLISSSSGSLFPSLINFNLIFNGGSGADNPYRIHSILGRSSARARNSPSR